MGENMAWQLPSLGSIAVCNMKNRKKMAITTSNGTQCFVEIERWDEVNKEAEVWVKVPMISSTADTTLYLYYDSAQDDNLYIGDTNSLASKNVWNSSYKAVYHMSQDPAGSTPLILDSAGYNNGIFYGSMTHEDLVDGQVGRAIAFDGADDYIGLGTWFNYQTFSIGIWVNPGTTQVQYADIIDNYHTGSRAWVMQQISTDTNHFCYGAAYNCDVCFHLTPNQWTNIGITRDGSSRVISLYLNGSLQQSCTGSANINYDGTQFFSIGRWNGGGRHFNGIIDDTSVSDIAHSPAWIKATYYSQSDNLISFGIRESALDIDPASKQTYNFTWNTGTTLAGDYIVRAKLYENGIFLTEDTANFAIISGKSLNAKISTDKISYNPNEQVAITSAVTSASTNYIFQNLAVRVTVTGSQGILTETKTIPMLTPDQTTDIKTYCNTAANPSGTYTVTLEVFEGTTLLSASTATFEILGSASTGGGLTGTISSQPNPIVKGNDETLTLTITNSGNEDMANLNAKVLIVNPDTQEIKAEFSSQWPITRGGTITETRTVSTASLLPGNYLAILQASTALMTQPKALASASFEVKEVAAGIEVSKTMPDVTNLLVWINDNESCQHSAISHQHRKNSSSDRKCEGHGEDNEDDKDNEDHGNRKDCIRLDLLENILKEAAADYMIVHDKKDFQRELRNPYYTDIVILGDHHHLEDHYGEELREKVYSGTGIISSLWLRHGHDEDGDKDEDPIFGIRHKDKHSGDYPVITNEYGLGKAAYLAFDFGATLNDENFDQMSTILKNAVAYIHKPVDTTAFHPNQLVPVEIKLKSPGGAFDLRVTETYPAELKLYDPSNGNWITDNPWITNIHLEADETKTVPYFVLSPDKAGAYTLQTEVGYMDNGTYTFYQNLNAYITVDKDAATMTGDIIAALNALTVSGKDKAKVRDAAKHIEKVQNRATDDKKDIEKNIHYTLKAIESLLYIKGADMSNARLMMDGLLRVLEGRYYLLNAR